MIKKEKNINILLFIRENCEYSNKVKKYFNKESFSIKHFCIKKNGGTDTKRSFKD